MSQQRTEHVMSAQPTERIERYRATLEEYLALPEEVRAEYVDGVVLVTPQPRWGHSRIQLQLARLFQDHLPGAGVGIEPGYRTAERRYRVPDIVVLPADEDDETVWLTQDPMIVVEVHSLGTRVRGHDPQGSRVPRCRRRAVLARRP